MLFNSSVNPDDIQHSSLAPLHDKVRYDHAVARLARPLMQIRRGHASSLTRIRHVRWNTYGHQRNSWESLKPTNFIENQFVRIIETNEFHWKSMKINGGWRQFTKIIQNQENKFHPYASHTPPESMEINENHWKHTRSAKCMRIKEHRGQSMNMTETLRES